MEDVRLKKLEEEKETKKQAFENGQCELSEYMAVSDKYQDRLNYLNSLQKTGENSRAVTIPLFSEVYVNQPESSTNNYLTAVPKMIYQLVDQKPDSFVHIRAYKDGTIHVDKEGYNTGPYESVIFDLNNIEEQQRSAVAEEIWNSTLMTMGEMEHHLANATPGFGSVFYEDKTGGLYPESEFIEHHTNSAHTR